MNHNIIRYSQGAALGSMVALLTYGKRQWEHMDEKMRQVIQPLYCGVDTLLPFVEADTSAFNAYVVSWLCFYLWLPAILFLVLKGCNPWKQKRWIWVGSEGSFECNQRTTGAGEKAGILVEIHWWAMRAWESKLHFRPSGIKAIFYYYL